MERSHIPLTKWALVFHLMAASKKGVSAKQVQRMLGFKSYKTAWFMCLRIREAMKPSASAGPIGGHGKVVESDETFVGGKAKNVHKGKPIPKKHAVHALVERGGQMRATHVADVSARTLRKAIAKHVAKGSTMNTDDALAYYHMSKEFAAHGVVNHSKDEYVSKDGDRSHSVCGGVLCDPQAWRDGQFSQRLRAALAAVHRRICVPMEHKVVARSGGHGARAVRHQGRGG